MAYLANDFIEHRGDDSAVNESAGALIFRSQMKSPDDALARFIELESQLHSALVAAPAPEARIRRIRWAHAIRRPILRRTRFTPGPRAPARNAGRRVASCSIPTARYRPARLC